MNSAEYVDSKIKELKNSGMPLMDAAWQAALLCVGFPYIFGSRGSYCTPSYRKSVYNSHTDQEGLVSKCKALSLDGGKAVITGNCSGCKWLPGGKKVRSFDCRGFTYWILLQIYDWKLMGAGCTTQWNNEDNWTAKGTVDNIPDDTLVCLFYKKKGSNVVWQHTGFGYKGETVECANGVQHFTTRNKKWTHWAIPKCVSDVPPDPGKKPTLRRGDTGAYVTLAQTELIQKGYDCGKWGADGKFGAATEDAVKRIQKDYGLDVTGVVDDETWAILDNPTPTTNLYTVSIPHLPKFKAEALVQQYAGASMIEERW